MSKTNNDSNTVTFNVRLIVNKKWIRQKIEKKVENAQAKLDVQVLKDCNKYCPMKTGTLIKSGITNTVPGQGVIIWSTPYAREQYYGKPNKSHQQNPNATMKWCETAKAKRIKVWEKLINYD